MPRRPRTVPGVKLDRLAVPNVLAVIAPAVAQVDAPHEGHILFDLTGMAHDHDLLMVRTASADPLIEEHLAASAVDLGGQPQVLLLAERHTVTVRTPEQASHIHATAAQVSQQGGDLRAGIAESFVAVAPPVGEADLLAAGQS